MSDQENKTQDQKKKPSKRRGCLSAIISTVVAVVAITVIVNASNSGSTKATTASPGSHQKTPTKYRPGEWISAGSGLLVKTMGASYIAKGAYSSSDCTAQGQFFFVDVAVKNAGKKSQTLDSSDFKVASSNGTKYSASSCGTTAANPAGKDMFLESLNPGLQTRSELVFDMPSGLKLKDLSLSFQNTIFGKKILLPLSVSTKTAS